MSQILRNKLGSIAEIQASDIGANGAVVGTPLFSAVAFGNGVKNGQSDYAKWESLTVPTTYTLKFWFKASSAHTVLIPIFQWTTGAGLTSFELYANGGTLYVGLVNAGGGYHLLYRFAMPTFSSGDILHMALVLDSGAGAGNRCKVYVDGQALSLSSIGADSTWTATLLTLLIQDYNNHGNNWYFDNLIIDNTAQTSFDYRFWQDDAGIPASVSATDGTYSDKVRISWTKIEAYGSQTFEVWRADSELGSYSKIADSITDEYYDDTTVTPGITYWYKVRALITDIYTEYSSSTSGYAQAEDPPGNSFAVRRATLATRPEKVLVDGIDIWQRELIDRFPILEYFRSFDNDRLFLNSLSISAFNIDDIYSVDNVRSMYKNINLRGKSVKIYDPDSLLVWDGKVYNYERNHNTGNIVIQSLHRLYANRYDKIAYASADWETGADAVKNILDATGITDYDLPSIYASKGYLEDNSCLLKVTVTKDDNMNLISVLEQIAKYSNADCYDFKGKIYFRTWRPQEKFLSNTTITDDDMLDVPTIKNYDKILRNDYSISYDGDGGTPATDSANGNIGAVSRTRNGTYSIDLTGDDKVLFKDLTSAVFFGEQSIRRTHRDLDGNPRPLQGMRISVRMDAGVWLDLQSVVKITFARESWVEKLFEIMYIGYDYERRILTLEMVEYAS